MAVAVSGNTHLRIIKYIANVITGKTSYAVATHDLVDRYGISVSQMTTDMFHLSQTFSDPFLIHGLSPGL
jgi:hypothetical protein